MKTKRMVVYRRNADIGRSDKYVFTGRDSSRTKIIATGAPSVNKARDYAKITLNAGGSFISIRKKSDWMKRYKKV
jgi:hypothetical protein